MPAIAVERFPSVKMRTGSRLAWTGLAVAAWVLASGPGAAQQQSLGVTAAENAAAFRYQIGRHITYVCPAIDPASEFGIWGTDVYTFDSAVCVAAVHAGVLAARQAGLVTFVIGPGAASFAESARNGVSSESYGPYDSSFAFDRSGEPGRIDGMTTLRLPEGYASPIAVICPPVGTYPQPLWGSDVYSDDSSICAAAAHAGVITLDAGGPVTVSPAGPQSSYSGSSRNGVTSQAYTSWPTSFRVSAAPPGAITATVPTSSPAREAGPRQAPSTSPVSSGPGTREIALAGFTAAGTAVPIVPRIIPLSGFSATGTAPIITPRNIPLTGWTATGAAP